MRNVIPHNLLEDGEYYPYPKGLIIQTHPYDGVTLNDTTFKHKVQGEIKIFLDFALHFRYNGS